MAQVQAQEMKRELSRVSDADCLPLARKNVSLDTLKEFRWDDFLDQAAEGLPTVYELVQGCFPPAKHLARQRTMGPRRNRRSVSNTIINFMIVSIL